MPSPSDRDVLLRRTLLMPERPRLGAFTLRPFSLWTLDLCEEIGLNLFFVLEKGTPPAGSEGFQLACLVWFHDASRKKREVDAHLQDGTWRREVKALQRSEAFTRSLAPVQDYVAYFGQLIAAAAVRVQKKKFRDKGEKEEKPPAAHIEPGSTFALIWSLSDGALASRKQLRFLYRGLSIPILLSFYHCALRASLAWTVPAATKKLDKVTAEKAREVVSAAIQKDRTRRVLF